MPASAESILNTFRGSVSRTHALVSLALSSLLNFCMTDQKRWRARDINTLRGGSPQKELDNRGYSTGNE